MLVVLVHVFEQGLVELDDVRIDIGERVQRRGTGSEVVDRYGNALFAQLVHEVLHRNAVFEVRNFGQLDFDVLAVDVVSAHDGKDLVCEGLVLEMLFREVRRNAYGSDTFVYPFAKVATDHFEYVEIQLADGSFLLEDGEEFCRRSNAVAEVPADKGFSTIEFTGIDAHLGLVVNDKFMFLEGFLEGGGNLLFVHDAFEHLGGVIDDILPVLVFRDV